MKQSRLMSLIESTVNIVVGFVISLIAQALFLPLLIGVQITFTQNFIFTVIMTVFSIARSYGLRRLFELLHIRRPLTPAMNATIAERFRQIEGEGWSLEHDDAHVAGELAAAGGSYAIAAVQHLTSATSPAQPATWPWSGTWWKPDGFRRDLVKAAALIIAEIEKFDRARKSRERSP